MSTYYKLFREELVADIAFLRRLNDAVEVRDFDNTIYLLRTASQHTNSEAEKFYTDWTSARPDWQTAAEDLTALLFAALRALAEAGLAVMRDTQATESWRQHAEIDVATVFRTVEEDLSLHFTDKNRARMVRQVETRLRVQPPRGGDRKQVVQDFCVQEIVSTRRPLPVPYHEVLDRLGLLGDRSAEGAILAAYSVEAIAPGLGGESFLARVEETWRAAADY